MATELPAPPQLMRIQHPETGHPMVLGIKRGMVFRVEVTEDESRGSEQWHSVNEVAPYVILSSDVIHQKMPLAIAAPLTTKLHKDRGAFANHRIRIQPDHVQRYAEQAGVGGLDPEPRIVLTEQIRVVAHERLQENPVAQLDDQALDAVEAGVLYALDVPVDGT